MLSTYFEIQRGTWPIPRSRDAERPKTAVETLRAAGLEPLLRVLDEIGDDAPLGDARPSRIDGAVDVAVGGEADVVEHDLVEARVGGGLRDRRAVVPDAPVVGIDPAEPGDGRPDAPVGALDGEVGTLAARASGPGSRRRGRSCRCRCGGRARRAPSGCRTAGSRRPCAPAARSAVAKPISPPSSLTSSSIVLRP